MIKIIEASFHRNGIGGVGFYAVLFSDTEQSDLMIASLFDEPGYCAVYCVHELSKSNIAFANGNSWRGDHYEGQLRPLLIKYLEEKQDNRVGPFAFPMKF
jgi:hypothetical protein